MASFVSIGLTGWQFVARSAGDRMPNGRVGSKDGGRDPVPETGGRTAELTPALRRLYRRMTDEDVPPELKELLKRLE